MTELGPSLINEALEEDDWFITFYGAKIGHASPSTPTSHHRKNPPDPALPARRDDALLQPQVMDRPVLEPQAARLEEGAPYEAVEEEEPQEGAVQLRQPIRPNYNMKSVLKKLPELSENEPLRAKRLLLGLHERLWHCPAQDLRNLLLRAGQTHKVIQLAAEAVNECAVCRKYIRLPNRPQYRAGGATSFNQTIQMDLYQLQGQWYILIIDEATRYKVSGAIPSQEHEDLMNVLMMLWIRYFGPPQQIVLDQQQSLMSHEAGTEFERLGITRSPRGTTAGPAGEQHTGTGLV